MTWLFLLVLLLCSGVVSGSETALFGLTRQDLRAFATATSPFHRRAALLMREPRHVLLTLLITNTTVNIAIFAISFVSFENLGQAHPVAASLGGVASLLAVIVGGEILPKSLAFAHARRIAPLVAPLVHTAQIAITPVRWILLALVVEPVTRLLQPATPDDEPISTEELRTLVESSAQQQVISSAENDMLQAVVGLAEVNVRAVMVPRVDVVAVSLRDKPESIRAILERSGRTRLPVYNKDIDDVRGLLYARDLYLGPAEPLARLVRPVGFVPEQCDLIEVIRHFRTTRTSLAMVVDEYGGVAGLVSLEDVLREIVGDLPGEPPSPTAPVAERIDADTYRLSGNLNVRQWASLFGIPAAGEPVNTLGGLVTAWIGRLPRVGDVVRRGNVTLTVESVRRRRIDRLIVKREPVAPTAPEGRDGA